MNDNQAQKRTWIGAIVVSLFPVLAQYSLPLISYGFVLLLIYFIIKFFDGNGQLCINRAIFLFIVYALMQQLIVYLASGTFSTNRNTYFFMIICLFFLASSKRLEKESFIKVYYVIALICSVLVLYQFVMSNIIGIPQSAIQILPVDAEDQHYWMANKMRASGLFTEPQAYSSYVLPLLVWLLYEKKYKSAIFISICIFSSTSSQGIILAFVLWVMFLLIDQKNIVKKVFVIVGIAIGIIIALLGLRKIDIFSFTINKILSIDFFAYNIRLTKGFEIYSEMPLNDKIVGIGAGNLSSYLLQGDFDFFWINLTQEQLLGYITTMANTLVSYGLLGFFLYLNIFRKNIRTTSIPSKFLLLIIFLSSFSQTILFNSWFVLYWMIFEIYDTVDHARYKVINFTIGNRRKNAR